MFDQKETAVYAESLGRDISYMADRELRTTMLVLWGLLLATDTLRVAMGYKPKHLNDISELEEEINRL